MSNKRYRKGYTFELKVKKYFMSQGCHVFRTAGSHSVADLVGFDTETHEAFLIQCKAGLGIISKQELEDLKLVASECGAIPLLVTQNEKKRIDIRRIE